MVKLIFMSLFVFLLVAASALATTTTLSDNDLTMAYEDVRDVEFCLSGTDQEVLDVVVTNVCKDVNGLYGCQAGDDFAVGSLFTVVPQQDTMADGDCILATLTTTIENEADGGIFYYTINGAVGEAIVGSETGAVEVPEFGIIAGLAVLAGSGYILYRKRR